MTRKRLQDAQSALTMLDCSQTTWASRAHITALALSLLLAACDSDEPSSSYVECAGGVPLGCQCLAGRVTCGSGDATDDAGDTTGPNTFTTDSATPSSAGGALDAAVDRGAVDSGSASDAGTEGPGASTEAGASTDAASTPDADASSSEAVGVVGQHGALRAQGNRIVDADGQPVQLRGMSWFWSQWTDFYVADNVDVMVDDWHASLVRAAMGIENDGGYLLDAEANTNKVRTLVDRAIERGVYVIIDWHDHHAQDHESQAKAFFQQMAQEYGDAPNVIFEVYNEPVDVPWSTVKAYAEPLIQTIRAAGSNNLVIVGTPTWSQDVDVAAADPITSDDNVAYTLHFYANTHGQFLRDKAKQALDAGIPLFATEWGTCSADGNGSINAGETATWLSFLEAHSISWANWALNDKAEACSAVQPWGGSMGPWSDDQLTASGLLVKDAIP